MTVAFYFPGNVPVYAFPLIIGAGASLGLWWIAWRSRPEQIRKRLFSGFSVLAGGLLGGRVAYIGVNWPFFQNHPDQFLQIPFGGLAWPGAVAGGGVGILIAAWLGRQSLLALADAVTPLLFVITLAAWLACWMDGCAYGQPAQAWFSVPAKDEWGNLTDRWPLQFTGALLTLIIFLGFDRLARWDWWKTPGRLASLGGVMLGLEWWLLTNLRADPAPLWNGHRLETWAAIGFATLSAIAFVATLFLRARHTRLERS